MTELKPFGKNSEPIIVSGSLYKELKQFTDYKLKQILEDFIR